jgi:hypothetical protein
MDAHRTLPADDLPTDLVNAATAAAARDAEHVGLFLRELGLVGTPEQPVPLPARFLFHLAAALRLLVWESQGFFLHQAAGLPSADQALDDAFAALLDPSADPTELGIQVLRLSLERFAWHGLGELNADIALDDLTDDAALDVLAEFLWASRHVATLKEDCQP